MPRPVVKLLIFLGCITIFRLFYIAMFDLTPDEAYYWTWGLDLDWCYFDQPGGVAFVDRLITTIFGVSTWGLRVGAILFGLLGTLFVYLTARKLDFDHSQSSLSAALLHIIPLMAGGHVLMLHDTVMITVAVIMIYFITRAIFEEKMLWWILSGIFAALALYGKFSAVVLAPGICIFLLFSKKRRFWFGKVHPYLAVLAASLLFLPVVVWNKNNEWIALLAVRKLATKPDVTILERIVNVFDYIGSQAGLVTPIFIVMIFIISIKSIRRINDEKYEKLAFLAALFLAVFGYFLIQSFKAKVQGNWAALAYIPGAMLLGHYLLFMFTQKNKKWVAWGKAGFLLAVLTTLLFTLQPIYKIIPLPENLDITNQVHGWKELGNRVDMELEKRPDLILAARRYQVASELMFYCKQRREIYVANWSSRGNQFDLWNHWPRLKGKSVLYVDVQGRSGKLWRHFEKATPLSDFKRRRGDKSVSTVHLTILENFKMDGPLQTYFENPLKYSAGRMRSRLHGN